MHAWTASSRVGVITRTYVAATRLFLNRSRSSRGSAKAAVLPEPEHDTEPRVLSFPPWVLTC
jgi:hypothetical protein